MQRGVASAKQLAMMEKVLDVYCQSYHVIDPAIRDFSAKLVFDLFDSGFRDEGTLMAELIKRGPPIPN